MSYWVNSGRDWDSCVREISVIESEVVPAGEQGVVSSTSALRPLPTPVWYTKRCLVATVVYPPSTASAA